MRKPTTREVDAAFAAILYESFDRRENEHPMDTKKRFAYAAAQAVLDAIYKEKKSVKGGKKINFDVV